MRPINLFEYEAAAAAKLDPVTWDYYRSGALDEVTLRENRAAFDRLTLNYRVLVDVSERRLECSVLDNLVSMPVLVAPTAFHRLAHPDGELATARAASRAGTIMILSTLSNSSVEDVARTASGPVWFQLYVYKDRGATVDLVQRVEAAGCQALVLTVDAPLLGRRERDVRNRFQLPDGLRVENMLARGLGTLPPAEDSGLAAYFATLLDPSLTFDDISWLRSKTRLPVLVKGIVRPDDAWQAVDHGAAAVIVSNHGGRQLDGAIATIRALPEIARAAAGRVPVLLDGGVRRGTDVFKALALGASAVCIGRAYLWGLAAEGQPGVERVLEMLRTELELTMALAGCARATSITREHCQVPSPV